VRSPWFLAFSFVKCKNFVLCLDYSQFNNYALFVYRGVTLFQKVGGTNFRRHRGGGPWVGSGEGAMPPPQKMVLNVEKAHFGGCVMHSDVLILKLWFAVHKMLQDCATNYVSFSLTGCGSFMGMGGLAPLAPDKLRPSLPPRFPPPFLLHSLSFLAKLTRCSYAAACSL